jgi:hypothetical protein
MSLKNDVAMPNLPVALFDNRNITQKNNIARGA